MKVKFANKVFEVLYTKKVAGLTMYAVEDEPNHIDWLINVEVIDAYEKELKKIEPINKYEGLTDFERTLADICIGWIGEEPGWKQYIKDNADVLLKIAVEKFNSVQDTPFEQKPADLEEFISELSKQFPDVSFAKLSRIAVRVAKWAKPTDEEMKELLRTEYEKGRADTIAEMQKPAWSEEDEERLKSCLNILQAKGIMGVTETINTKWLKSLKQKIQHSEWNTEKKELNRIS